MTKYLFTYLIISCIIYSCSDESTNPVIPKTPTLQDSVVILVSPANDTVYTNPERIILKWNKNNLAASYQYNYSKDSAFQILSYGGFTDSLLKSVNAGGLDTGKYHWRIGVGEFGHNAHTWSEVRKFDIRR